MSYSVAITYALLVAVLSSVLNPNHVASVQVATGQQMMVVCDLLWSLQYSNFCKYYTSQYRRGIRDYCGTGRQLFNHLKSHNVIGLCK